jgi:magnesium-transporting ATPase (P-type)
MTKKNIYLILAVIGFIAPYYFFLQLPAENGFDLPRFMQPLFANNFMKGVAMDLTVSVIVFWFFMFAEANKLQMKNPWLYLLATLLVGLSFALPLFLYFRSRKLEASPND